MTENKTYRIIRLSETTEFWQTWTGGTISILWDLYNFESDWHLTIGQYEERSRWRTRETKWKKEQTNQHFRLVYQCVICCSHEINWAKATGAILFQPDSDRIEPYLELVYKKRFENNQIFTHSISHFWNERTQKVFVKPLTANLELRLRYPIRKLYGNV